MSRQFKGMVLFRAADAKSSDIILDVRSTFQNQLVISCCHLIRVYLQVFEVCHRRVRPEAEGVVRRAGASAAGTSSAVGYLGWGGEFAQILYKN